LKNNKIPVLRDEFSFKLVTEIDVLNVVKQLQPKRSTDHFGFSNFLIKETISYFVLPFTRLVNKCFLQGKFPDVLKITKVIPIFKKGSTELLVNYGPIALVPVLSKVIEVIIGTQLANYLESNKLFCNSQFGFRKGLSTTHALISLVDDILNCFEGKAFAAVTFCDLSKAFDCVSHSLIVEKLHYYNVRGLALDVFKN